MHNWLDLALAIIMIVSIISGIKLGFTKTAISLFASILGLVFGLHYYRAVAVSLRPHITKPWVADLIGFLIIFLGIVVLGEVVIGILARFIRTVHLVWLDRTLGGAFGVVRGLLFCSIVIWGLMAFLPVEPKLFISQSRLAPCVMDAARRVADASPDEVKRTFRQSYRELNRILPEKVKERFPNAPSSVI